MDLATIATRIETRAARQHDDGEIDAAAMAETAHACNVLRFIASHTDGLRRIAQRFAAMNRLGVDPAAHDYGDTSSADLMAEPAVAAVLAAFPGSVLSNKPLPPISPPDAENAA